MFTKQQLSFKYIPLKNISFHKDIPRNMRSIISSVTNKLSDNDGFTVKGLELFLQMHPIHAIKRSRKDKYDCITNLRSYQLAKNCLDENHLIPLLIHNRIQKEDIETLAVTDALLTSLVYGLDNSAWSNDLLNLFDSLNSKLRKEILLSLENKKKLMELIGRSTQSIYTPNLPPTSSLKKKQNKRKP